MANFLVIIPVAGIGLVSLVNWIAAWNTQMILYYVTKPIVLLGLILYLVFRVPITSARLPFLIGLIFSLIGDIFLIPKGTRWFLAGVGAFSITQVMYIWGFNLSRAELPAMIVAAVAYLGGVVLIHLVVDRFAQSSSVSKTMLPFFKAYGALVLAMSLSALMCLARPAWSDLAAVMAGIGGILFFISDGMICLGKLDRQLPKNRFWIIVSYHLAQFLITAAVMQLGG